MKNENIIFNGYIPFYNNSNFNILEKESYVLYKDNNNNNKNNQSVNIFQRNFRSKIPMIKYRNQKKQFEIYEPDKNSKKDSHEPNNNLPSYPNVNNINLFKKVSLNSKNLNSIYNKIQELKNNNQISPLKMKSIDSLTTKINTENYKLNQKKEKEIEK